MHIYIRTGDNENTGIEFLNGKGWSEQHIGQKGFYFTPQNSPARRYEFKDPMRACRSCWGTKNEKSLAALVLLDEALRGVPEGETVESVTWISVGARGLSSRDMLHFFHLENFRGSQGGEVLNDEVRHIIYDYLNEAPREVRVTITDEDFERVRFDSTERDRYGFLLEENPQGFSVRFEDKVLHYSVPEFLRHAVRMLTEEQEQIAKAVLIADKLSCLEPSTPVMADFSGFYGKLTTPAPAGELLERVQHFICTYVVNDKEEHLRELSSIRKVRVDEEVLKCVAFKDSPEYVSHPELLSNLHYYRSVYKIGFEVRDYTGRIWKFTPVDSDKQSELFMLKFEDRPLAIATLAALRVADKYQYYGELQIISDVLSDRLIGFVNDLLRGRDYYELVDYLKRYFDVEEVRS